MCTAVARLLATVAALATAVSGAKIVYEAGELKLQDPDEVGSVVVSPLPHTYLKPSDIPAEWNPHDIDGITLVTSDLNQHIPQCNSHTHARARARTHTHTHTSKHLSSCTHVYSGTPPVVAPNRLPFIRLTGSWAASPQTAEAAGPTRQCPPSPIASRLPRKAKAGR